YFDLTAKERLSLLVAASARNDGVERQRLAWSAPTCRFELPNYFGLSSGMQNLTLFHSIQLLDLAALYWHAAGMLEQEEYFKGKEGTSSKERLLGTACMLAYVFTVNVDGWKRFCSELEINADILLRDMPGYSTLIRAEEAARIMAFTPEEAANWMREASSGTTEAITVSAVAASLRDFLDRYAEMWS